MLAAHILGVVLLIASLLLLIVRKIYFALPELEMRRRAPNDWELKIWLRAVNYGDSLRLTLWILVSVFAAVGLALIVRTVPFWVGFLAILVWLFLAFVLLPELNINAQQKWLATKLTPTLAKLTAWINPLGARVSEVWRARFPLEHGNQIYQREDLVNLLKRQKLTLGNQIPEDDIELTLKVLKFGSYQVKDAMLPKSKIRKVNHDDTVGPMLLDELYKNGLTDFPVFKGREAVGILSTKDLELKSTGKVSDFLKPEVNFVHENDTLSQVLHAFYATRAQMFVVVNSSNNYIGIITIEQILHLLLGKLADQASSNHADRKAVAARHPKTP